jgi:hypothetical protein
MNEYSGLTIRPRCSRILGSTSSHRCALKRSCVPFLIRTHQARIAHHIGGEDRGQSTGGSHGGHCSGGFNSLTKVSPYFECENVNFERPNARRTERVTAKERLRERTGLDRPQ